MMSTAVRQEIKTEMSETQELFPLLVRTEQSSLNYMKRLTAVAISNILYLRNVFTEDCYGHRKLDHLKLRILTERCETVGAQQIVQWVKGCFDAMEKKYLKQMTVGIYSDPSQPEDLIEAYTFRFSYPNNRFNCNISLTQKGEELKIGDQSDTSELRNATIQLMRSLIIMAQSLDRLPDNCFLTMKLLYYDDITPEDYEPPGFKASDKDSFTFKGKPISISAGEVVTGFHTLKVKIRTNQKQFQDFASSQSSDNEMRELNDECSPLQIGDSSAEDRDYPKSSENKDSETKTTFSSKKNKSPINSSKNFVKQSIKPSVSSKESHKQKTKRTALKVDENNVITKMKDMRVEDNYLRREEKRSIDLSKRKHDCEPYEETQDSVFSMAVPSDKRFKASDSNKSIPIGNKR